MKILVTGGMGFIGSHVAEYHAARGDRVVIVDNLSRGKLLGKAISDNDFNRNYLRRFANIEQVEADIRDGSVLREAARGCEVIFHAAGQTAVTASIVNPAEDFTCNAVGTINVLEAARHNGVGTVVYCSTNKVYGDNVNRIGIVTSQSRYSFEETFRQGIGEDFPTDRCEHTPYGCSKLTGDLYCQEYAHHYGIRTGVFRMSCIYGTRQFGVEDQGWVAWLAYALLNDLPIKVFGDGKQVRDLLYITDLLGLYEKFIQSGISHEVFNVGGGSGFSVSILELLEILQELTGKRANLTFAQWRHSDQKVYISDIAKAASMLAWQPQITPREGVRRLVEFLQHNRPNGLQP